MSGTIPDSCCITTVFLSQKWPMGMCVKCDIELSFPYLMPESVCYSEMTLKNNVCDISPGLQLLLVSLSLAVHLSLAPKSWRTMCVTSPQAYSFSVSLAVCLSLAPKSSQWHWPNPELYSRLFTHHFASLLFHGCLYQQTLCHLQTEPRPPRMMP